MSVSQPAVVIFDLGNVLVHIRPEAFLQTLGIDTPENRRTYQHSVIDIVKRYERGEDSTETFLQNLGTLFNVRNTSNACSDERRQYSRDDFQRAMLAIIELPIPGMEELVRTLGTKVPLGLLSNTNPLHFDACMENLAVLRSIPFHFLSYRLRLLKPEPEIFEKTIELLRHDPRDVLYIDDLSENIEAARRAGLHGYHFVGVDELNEYLSSCGLV
ncbi:MAG: HAD family phosphatase [Ignavibacteriales bacterium]|nr:HAD family phosphatase [Ignavibacteriales bacterium]